MSSGVGKVAIGLFGGTFNPIHNGHLKVAARVLSLLKLSRMMFIPCKRPPHKQDEPIESPIHRMKMVSLAIADHPRFESCDIEIKRRGLSYTIDTLLALKHRNPAQTFFFVIGTDAFSNLSKWKEPERLLEICSFVIVPRPGYPFLCLPKLKTLTRINRDALTAMDQKERQSYTFRTGSQTKLYFRNIPLMDISASTIRAQIKERKRIQTPCRAYSPLPQRVLSYIIEKKLYL
jgi:nicotinate-nucleotide adenylyltransferase